MIYNKCHIKDLQREWIVLKTIVKLIYGNDTKAKYLDIWERVFTNEETVKKCDNILHLIKILLITHFSNRKLERMLSRMLRVKNDWLNLDVIDYKNFNPDSY